MNRIFRVRCGVARRHMDGLQAHYASRLLMISLAACCRSGTDDLLISAIPHSTCPSGRS